MISCVKTAIIAKIDMYCTEIPKVEEICHNVPVRTSDRKYMKTPNIQTTTLAGC